MVGGDGCSELSRIQNAIVALLISDSGKDFPAALAASHPVTVLKSSDSYDLSFTCQFSHKIKTL